MTGVEVTANVAAPVRYPFTAVVGQEQLKLALILSAVSPGIGGVLIRGEKGTAKSTIVRALGPLLARDGDVRRGHVVELPIGATEDRVVGSLDLTAVLRDGRAQFTPGLLARADGGVLYIDEVNLLADHLVDVLLDAAASGRVTVERDGISHTQPADFVLVGTMNPEEGELRPQLLDRFGLAVDVKAGLDVDERVEIIRRRIDFDADPQGFIDRYALAEKQLAARIATARALVGNVSLPVPELRRIAGICAHLGVDGLRGDIVLARAAAAHAALRGAPEITAEDVRVAAELALPHRRRRNPFDESGLSDQELGDALAAGADAAAQVPPEPDPDGGPGGGETAPTDPADAAPDATSAAGVESGTHAETNSATTESDPETGESVSTSAQSGEDTSDSAAQAPAPSGPRVGTPAGSGTPRLRALRVEGIGDGEPGKRSRARSRRGHTSAAIDFTAGTPIHLFGTVLRAAAHHTDPGAPVRIAAADLRGAQRIGQESNLVVFLVDLSGSMTARHRLSAVSGVCVDLLRDSYTRRDRVAVVVARGSQAQVVLPPTRSIDIAVRRLAQVRTGGRTPLAEGLVTAADLIERARRIEPDRRPLLVVLTDGRATAGPNASARAAIAATAIADRGLNCVVVDCEQGMIRLGLAADLARQLNASYLKMSELSATALSGSGLAGFGLSESGPTRRRFPAA
ncbi:MAG: VWA domain-containing protein [Gordonia sp. (in: high G+C Gram-positive bacteria)]